MSRNVFRDAPKLGRSLPSYIAVERKATHLQTGLRRVRLLRLTGVVAASLPTGLATSLACITSVIHHYAS